METDFLSRLEPINVSYKVLLSRNNDDEDLNTRVALKFSQRALYEMPQKVLNRLAIDNQNARKDRERDTMPLRLKIKLRASDQRNLYRDR